MTRFGVTLAIMLCFARVHAQIPEMPQSEFEAMVEELSNWGRWGREDQIGALNLITPEKRLQAAKLVKEGISISPRTRSHRSYSRQSEPLLPHDAASRWE